MTDAADTPELDPEQQIGSWLDALLDGAVRQLPLGDPTADQRTLLEAMHQAKQDGRDVVATVRAQSPQPDHR